MLEYHSILHSRQIFFPSQWQIFSSFYLIISCKSLWMCRTTLNNFKIYAYRVSPYLPQIFESFLGRFSIKCIQNLILNWIKKLNFCNLAEIIFHVSRAITFFKDSNKQLCLIMQNYADFKQRIHSLLNLQRFELGHQKQRSETMLRIPCTHFCLVIR